VKYESKQVDRQLKKA